MSMDLRAAGRKRAAQKPNGTGAEERKAMTTEKASEKTLADESLETYDLQGQTAMMSFIMKNAAGRDMAGQGEKNRNQDRRSLWNAGMFTLRDRSYVAIARLKEGPVFITDREQEEHTRPAATDPSRLPPYPGPLLPMLDWPNSDSIRDILLEKIEVMARERAGMEPTFGEIALEASEAVTIAPGLDHAIRAAIEQLNQDEGTYRRRLLDILDQHGDDCAQNAMTRIPEEQLEALIGETSKMIGRSG